MRKEIIAYLNEMVDVYIGKAGKNRGLVAGSIYKDVVDDFLMAINFISDLQEENQELEEQFLEVNGELI